MTGRRRLFLEVATAAGAVGTVTVVAWHTNGESGVRHLAAAAVVAGLLYLRAGARPMGVDGCVNHLHGRWWEWAEPDGADCPIGFRFFPSG